jgi:hypothetical protein
MGELHAFPPDNGVRPFNQRMQAQPDPDLRKVNF